jgi:hypothetical protein
MNLAGRTAAQRMEEPENVIYAYTDEQALEDGVLVAVLGGKVNRVTRAVFDHFSQPLLNTPVASLITDSTKVVKAIEFMSKLEADSDGWRTGTYEGKELWLVPNEVEGLTLMFRRTTEHGGCGLPGTIQIQPLRIWLGVFGYQQKAASSVI